MQILLGITLYHNQKNSPGKTTTRKIEQRKFTRNGERERFSNMQNYNACKKIANHALRSLRRVIMLISIQSLDTVSTA